VVPERGQPTTNTGFVEFAPVDFAKAGTHLGEGSITPVGPLGTELLSPALKIGFETVALQSSIFYPIH